MIYGIKCVPLSYDMDELERLNEFARINSNKIGHSVSKVFKFKQTLYFIYDTKLLFAIPGRRRRSSIQQYQPFQYNLLLHQILILSNIQYFHVQDYCLKNCLSNFYTSMTYFKMNNKYAFRLFLTKYTHRYQTKQFISENPTDK